MNKVNNLFEMFLINLFQIFVRHNTLHVQCWEHHWEAQNCKLWLPSTSCCWSLCWYD